ncbi:aminopeptidase P family protein [Mangrovicella endophytica]|uniref:aminopeptidase P family protein n=1 Tax=Mangrovicella endophytica TaxID=2066697 RepID=UPI000C9DEA20|nr:aminopeptidase P family protein [Mangrovicella endophytica]
MFQSFDEITDFSRSAMRVAQLRAGFAEAGIDGFLVPRADEHQGEYIAPSAARLQWLTGFSGSAGMALVLADKAVIFVDGRYTLQVRSQVDLSVFTPESSVEMPLAEWLRQNASGLRIGFDPWLHTLGEVRALRQALESTGGALVALKANPVDRIWNERPAPPKGAVSVQPEALAGKSAAEKLAELQAAIGEGGGDYAVLTDPSSVAWTFNIRGSDVSHTPLPLSFALIGRDGRHSLFIDPDKLDSAATAHLSALCELAAPEAFERVLRSAAKGARVLLDPSLGADRIAALVTEAGGTVVEKPDPARVPRARKNEAEIAGSRAAHRRDGAAITSFLHWLDNQTPGSVTEIEAAETLEAFRAQAAEKDGMPLRDVSFDTIAGSGPNGAIVHYRVNRESNRPLGAGELFLIDSGAQYQDGTTDITRTVPIGTPSEEMRQRFTLVLKGMIAIATARFPKGTRGVDIDVLARIALWKAGLDYAHGTGHGVGAYLAVHEGPVSISRRGMAVIETGMILSDEPGYYREGAYGIRIENLILTQAPSPIEGGDLPMHAFETLTFAPIDRRLIVPSMLERSERLWIDNYHAEVRALLTPLLESAAAEWLGAMTQPLEG